MNFSDFFLKIDFIFFSGVIYTKNSGICSDDFYEGLVPYRIFRTFSSRKKPEKISVQKKYHRKFDFKAVPAVLEAN